MDFRPWMIEAAFDFIRGSRLLWDNGLCSPSMVNVAIGLEILLKSFTVAIDGPSRGIGEQYRVVGRPRHNLLELFDSIPLAIIDRLGLGRYRAYFEEPIGDLFLRARYPYERDSIAGGTCAIIEVAEEMFDRVLREYKEAGCTDPWIIAFPNV